jgi:UDP-N-acetylmuramate dehydrogenase
MTLISTPLELQEGVPLAPWTAFGIGGPARFFAQATRESHIFDALEFSYKMGCPIFVLGGGSNLLVSDRGYEGLVLHIALTGILLQNSLGNNVVTVAAGEPWDPFVALCVKQNLAGIECMSGIPGTIGGTPIQNVGAYGEEASDTIVSVRALDRETGQIEEVSSARCRFAYRTSIFNTTHRDRFILLSVTFALRSDGRPRLTHRDLLSRFAGSPLKPSVQEVREAILSIRAGKGMLLSPDDADSKSAGSFFKNPVVSQAEARRIEETARRANRLGADETLPCFRVDAAAVKLPAAWLVERSGFCRGFAQGAVGLSTKHVLALVNRGGARAQDVVNLMLEIQASVKAAFGVELLPEPVFVGF